MKAISRRGPGGDATRAGEPVIAASLQQMKRADHVGVNKVAGT